MERIVNNVKRRFGNFKLRVKSTLEGDYYKGKIDRNHPLYPKSHWLINLIDDNSVEVTNYYYPGKGAKDIHPLVYRFKVNGVEYLATEGFVVSTPVLSGFIQALAYWTENVRRNLSYHAGNNSKKIQTQTNPDFIQVLDRSNGELETNIKEGSLDGIKARVIVNVENRHFGLANKDGDFDKKGLKERLRELKPKVNVSGGQPIQKASFYYDGNVSQGKINNNPALLKSSN